MTHTSTQDIHTATGNLAILGLGAIGTLMAWHCREQQPLAVSRTHCGANRQLLDRDQHLHQLNLPEWQHQPLEWLIVTTKASDTLSALIKLKDKLPLIRNILLLQNGMGQQQQVYDWLCSKGQSQVLLWVGTSTEGAYRQNDTHVIYAGEGETLIGPWQSSDLLPLSQLPEQTKIVNNIRQRLYDKLAINAVINPLTGQLRCKNGELINNPKYYTQLAALADEVSAFFQHQNWSLSFDLTKQAQTVCLATAQNQSSTLQDVIHQRPTELAFISGFLLNQAQQVGYSLPITEHLYKALS